MSYNKCMKFVIQNLYEFIYHFKFLNEGIKMKDEDNFRFSTRLSNRHKIKLKLLRIKNRRLVETAIDEASSNTERYEKIVDYHFYKNRLKDVRYEIEKLQLEEDLLTGKIEELEVELRDSSEKLHEVKNPELRQAILIIQNALHRNKDIYVSDSLTDEQVIYNFVTDKSKLQFVNATFNAPYVPKLTDEERLDYLYKYVDMEKIRKTDFQLI